MRRDDKRPVVLVVLDGWGYRPDREGNAIAHARVPTWDRIWARGTRTLLDASGPAVGLPEGQIGNSEVGHLNLGAGRVVIQDLPRVSKAIQSGDFFQNETLRTACAHVRASGGTLHLMGLVGDGGVHAHQSHAIALVDLAHREGVGRVAIHAMMDGRDTMPTSGLGYLTALAEATHGRALIASVGGRYFGMDRDNRWPRVERWYRACVDGTAPAAADALQVVRDAYARGETDEFISPATIHANGAPVAPMRDGDALVTWNYRADRMRQIVRAVAIEGFDGFVTQPRPRVHTATMTRYDATFPIPAAFAPTSMSRIVAEVLSDAGLSTLRTAETEKYAHVTYFFNGGLETPYSGEERMLVPSQQVATYDLAPEMSAPGITDVLCKAIESGDHAFTLCNYANGDMVGHTGNFAATVRACEIVDECLARIIYSAEQKGTRLLITADHGNCEMMIDPATGGPHTAHTTNAVPFVLVDPAGASGGALRGGALRAGGALRDVGPTILELLGVGQPSEMTGRTLMPSPGAA
ncbi:MAG: 2,3-bisphosphoglycerate-independent phosphoglycerate mutase [Gemmatimonadetes bacterium]|nr:2,3-bisphosphoglycerate-independent phosphoglycerate mutase [Gemmatimonadota bacterium]